MSGAPSKLTKMLADRAVAETLEARGAVLAPRPSGAALEALEEAGRAFEAYATPRPPPPPAPRRLVGYMLSRRTSVNVRGTSVYLDAGKMVVEPVLIESLLANRVVMTAVYEGDDIVACPHCQKSFMAEFGRTVAFHQGLRPAV